MNEYHMDQLTGMMHDAPSWVRFFYALSTDRTLVVDAVASISMIMIALFGVPLLVLKFCGVLGRSTRQKVTFCAVSNGASTGYSMERMSNNAGFVMRRICNNAHEMDAHEMDAHEMDAHEMDARWKVLHLTHPMQIYEDYRPTRLLLPPKNRKQVVELVLSSKMPQTVHMIPCIQFSLQLSQREHWSVQLKNACLALKRVMTSSKSIAQKCE